MVTYSYERQDIIQFALKRLPGGLADASFFRDAHYYRNGLAMKNIVVVTGSKYFAIWSQSNLGVSAVSPLVTF
jgi:hypothetical protein